MLNRGDKRERPCSGPGSDWYRTKNTTTPDPRIEIKHVSNAPIVTIFGAGVAGLTAAHELADRGFLVQVVEKARDAYSRGRPLVGGMAASQYTRVRANIEELHAELLDPELRDNRVVQWLLRLFQFNRSWWIQAEAPIDLLGSLYSSPLDPLPGSPDLTIGQHVARILNLAKLRYRDDWVWDLLFRSVFIATIRGTTVDASVALRPELIGLAQDICARLADAGGPFEVAVLLLKEELAHLARMAAVSSALPELPTEGQLHDSREIVESAMEREFLQFHLLPYARDHENVDDARRKQQEWEVFLARNITLADGLVVTFKYNLVPAHPAPARVRSSAASSKVPFDAGSWLELDVTEQRMPGEHGYRFFPSYYRHLDDTMRRIPLFDGDRDTFRTAYDNLVPVPFQAIGLSEEDRAHTFPDYVMLTNAQIKALPRRQRREHEPVEIERDRPKSFEGLRDRTERFLRRLGCSRRDGVLFSARLLRFMSACPERRRKEYEAMSWAEFIGIRERTTLPRSSKLPYSKAMKFQIEAAAQALLALSAAEADARTYGDAVVQLLLDMLDDGAHTDRMLNGPTSDAWLEPWRDYLERRGVRFFLGELKALELVDAAQQGRVELVPTIELLRDRSQGGHALFQYYKDPAAGTELAKPGRQPDFYVLALDLKQAVQQLTNIQQRVVAPRAPSADFAALKAFYQAVTPPNKSALKNMTGVQFFFDSKTSIGKGHIYFPSAEWGLSSISQSEFWSPRGGFIDGYLGVLSVDVCQLAPEHGPSFVDKLKTGALVDRRRPGFVDDRLGRWLVSREIFRQMKDRIGTEDEFPEPRAFHLDRNIGLSSNAAAGTIELNNTTEYLASLPGTWRLRPGIKPGADTEKEIQYSLHFDRWVMCGTFMATHTRLTTMEAANESARHAVVAILDSLKQDDSAVPRQLSYNELSLLQVEIDTGANVKYNAASARRIFDPPDIYDPEEREFEDLAVMQRLDERLIALGLPHWMDICEFDRRVVLMLEMADLYLADGSASKRLDEMLKLAFVGLETSLQEVLGDNYLVRPAVDHIIDLAKQVYSYSP